MKKENPNAKWEDFLAALGPCPYPPPEGRKSAFRPCGLVETMVKRIAPYTITGFLYYQGESDCKHPYLYRALLRSLIVLWRDLFKSPALPFLNVQLPMFDQRDVPGAWPILRHAQAQVHAEMRNTGLAVMIDGGDPEDIHPQDKKTVGERLCDQALQVVYKQKTENSPMALSARADRQTILVTVSTPLRHENTPLLFELAGEDGEFVQADARIHETEIIVSSKGAPNPRFVRYAWVNYSTVNVFGDNGLPLAPFTLRG